MHGSLKVKDTQQVDILFGILKGSRPLENANRIVPPKPFPIGYAPRHDPEKMERATSTGWIGGCKTIT